MVIRYQITTQKQGKLKKTHSCHVTFKNYNWWPVHHAERYSSW